MATQPLDANTSPAPRRWRGVVRFFAWLTVVGAGTLIASYLVASRHLRPPDSSGLLGPLRFDPFSLVRELFAGLSAAHFNAILLLFAPLGIAALSALFSLGGPPWRRVMLALLSLLVAAYNLFTCLSLVWAFFWNGATAGVIDTIIYVALSASLMGVVAAFGVLFMALVSAWRWPRLQARGARIVARWWATLIVSGAALLVASYFTVWGGWRSPGPPVSGDTLIPIELYRSVQSGDQVNALLPLLAPPVIAALSASLTLFGPRWRRLAMGLLALLAGMSGMAVCLMLLGRLFLRVSGYSVLTTGGVVGLGASALIVIATFGLLSVPYPPLRRAPSTRVLTEGWPLNAA